MKSDIVENEREREDYTSCTHRLFNSFLKLYNEVAFFSSCSRLLKSIEAWYVGRCFPLFVFARGKCRSLWCLVLCPWTSSFFVNSKSKSIKPFIHL